MIDLTYAGTEQRLQVNGAFLERLKTALPPLINHIFCRQCLLAELDSLPDGALEDIGLTEADLTHLRRTSVSPDGLRHLAARLRERLA